MCLSGGSQSALESAGVGHTRTSVAQKQRLPTAIEARRQGSADSPGTQPPRPVSNQPCESLPGPRRAIPSRIHQGPQSVLDSHPISSLPFPPVFCPDGEHSLHATPHTSHGSSFDFPLSRAHILILEARSSSCKCPKPDPSPLPTQATRSCPAQPPCSNPCDASLPDSWPPNPSLLMCHPVPGLSPCTP